jgi:pilus assembly protein CpaE
VIKKILTVLLIEDSPEYAELVQRWLAPRSEIEIEFVLNWTDSLMVGLNRLAKGGVDAILLDLGLPDSDGLGTFTTTKIHAPGVPIVVLSGLDTEALALQMVLQGAQDYIIKSACSSDILVKAILFAVGRSSQKAPGDAVSGQGTVIGVMGAKGGVGTTTLTCNLAVELRRQTEQATLIADLDVNAGLVAFFMNVEAQYSILDAVANLHRLDRSYWEGIVSHSTPGVDIMRSPHLLGVDDDEIRKIRHVLTLIRTFYRWTVLDLGRMNALSLSLLDMVTNVYLVTTVGLPALYEAKRTIGALVNAGLETERLRLILIETGAGHEFSESELARLFGVPVYARLPAAAQELEDARTRGKLLGAKSEYRVRMSVLARKIAGLLEEPAGPVAHLRSFAGRFRRNNKDAAGAERISP